MVDAKRKGPLDDCQRTHLGITAEVVPATHGITYNLRGHPEQLAGPIQEMIGLVLPTTPNQVVANENAQLLWLGPDEWLLDLLEPALADGLNHELEKVSRSLVPVDHGLVRVRLSGEPAFSLLATGTPLDITEQLRPGHCLQTRLAHVSVILTTDAEQVTIWVRRSMAHYLWRWLQAGLDRMEPMAP